MWHSDKSIFASSNKTCSGRGIVVFLFFPNFEILVAGVDAGAAALTLAEADPMSDGDLEKVVGAETLVRESVWAWAWVETEADPDLVDNSNNIWRAIFTLCPQSERASITMLMSTPGILFKLSMAAIAAAREAETGAGVEAEIVVFSEG
jgi:hypothetical protein